ncbi:hypothetical protein QZH41_006023 [Actinostola sp. cb2023]|nr:hypothetical protein QZH41_006023 [Actinostola sp. cb2023]
MVCRDVTQSTKLRMVYDCSAKEDENTPSLNDCLETGGDDPEHLFQVKREATEIMESGGFCLHKWHSNVPEAEENDLGEHANQAASSLSVKILGVPWNKSKDELTISFEGNTERDESQPLTKRKIEKRLDEEITYPEILREWTKWLKGMGECTTVQCSPKCRGPGYQGKGTWSQFVRNRSKVIQEKDYLQWQNPNDIGSRGAAPRELSDMWLQGPDWMADKEKWPPQPEVTESDEIAKEKAKTQQQEKQLMAKEEPKKQSVLDALLDKYSSCWKLQRVVALVQRFLNNCRSGEKRTGPLSTEEIGGDDQRVALNRKAAEFVSRVGPRRQAKDSAKDWMHGILLQENDDE